MNKKQNLLAIAISASFIIGGANVAQASENTTSPVVEENITNQVDTSNANQGNSLENESDTQTNDNKEEDEKVANNADADKNLLADKIVEPAEPKGDAQPADELQKGPEMKAVAYRAVAPMAEPSQAQDDQSVPEQKSDDFNYAEDEKKVGNYRDTQLEQGNGPAFESNEPSMDMKDGFRYNTLEPGTQSPDKKKWGIEIEIDKEKGQRTYTDFGFTNSGRLGNVLNNGNVTAKSPEEGKLAEGFKDPNYKANTNIEITGSTQKNLNTAASDENLKNLEEDLKHINKKDNKNTTMVWEGRYKIDNPNGLRATQGDSAVFNFAVNPWPNENDMLDPLKLSGDYREKVFVKGQTINTGVKVENLDENARERLVGQVYSSVTGEIVPEAKAYVDENGIVQIKLPAGSVNEDGTINKDSIFYKNPAYRGLTSLDVKFFARPRTKAEFENVVNESNNRTGYASKYVGTDAGTGTIKHKGQDVVFDKQGIARYDHYNLIGSLNLQLDDTRYYDQDFAHKDKDKNITTEVKDDELTDILPGKDFTVEMFKPEKGSPHQKTGDEMNNAQSKGEAVGEINTSSLDEKNKALAEKEGVRYEDFIKDKKYKDKRWEIKTDKNDIAKFTIKAPENAKSGESVSLNVKYTYTNGSTDRKVFYFVVQDSAYIKPEYKTQVNFPAIEQKSPATIPEDDKKEKPKSYSLPDEDEEGNPIQTIEEGKKIFNDDKGNKWAVSIDETSGEVTAKPVDQANFNGGEKLTVPVISHYTDPNDSEKDVTEKANAEFVIKERFNKTPRYNAKAGKVGDKLSSEIILDKNDTYNREPSKFTLASDTFTDDKGNTWNVTIDEKTGQVTATVPNAEEGKTIDGALLNVPVIAHYYEMQNGKPVESGTKEVEVQFVAYGTNGKVEKIEEIPFETKVEKDPNLKKGEIKVITEGEKGSKKVTYTIEDSKITDTKEEELKAPQERLIHVGEGVADGNHEIKESSEIAFETEIQFDDSLAPGETKVEQEGELGKKTRTTIINIQDGNVTSTVVGDYIVKKEPVKKIIKVGRNTEGKVEHKEELPFKYKVEEVDTLKKGEYKIVKPGKVGTKTTTWTIKNSKVEGDPTVTEVAAEDALIQVGKGTNEGTHEVVEKKNIDYKTIIEYDENLDAGQQEVVKEGNPGEQERTNTLVIKDGKVSETKEGEFKTTKEATDRVVKVGTKPVTKVVEKPFNTEYVYDENLESGKTEEVTPGKNGKVTITTTYDKDQKKVVTSETEEAGQNRVVKIGGKTNGTEKVKEEIPFEVEVRKDPSLKKGEWKYATDDEGNELKGEKGEQEKTLTIENSKVTKTSEPTVTKKAKNAVILVGDEDFTGKIKSVDKDPIPFETEVTVDPSLKPGQIVEDQKGELGEQETELTREIKNGTAGEEVRGETKRTKEPVTRKIRVGAKSDGTHTYTNKKPFEVEVRVNPELKKGEHKVVQKGVEGEEEFTVTIENSKVTKTSEPKETKAPVKEIIEVGSDDFTGTFETKKTKAVEFETEYIVDETLEPGKTVVDKEGKLGEEEITVTHTIVNGKVTKSEESKPIQTKAPEKRIVRVGKKPSEGETTKTIEREIPYETKVIYDETLEAGFQKIENEGKPGKEEVTITQKIKDSKPVGEATETTKTITEKEDRVVRIGVKPVVKETELGNNTEYRHNPELKAGEEKVVEEGSKGSVKYTTTFNKETGKLEVKEERIEPKNKVVEYGSKTDGEFTYESEKAYDIIIRENPNLEAGKTKVIQEGKPGKTETTVKIENSKEVSRDTKTITEKQDKIIEIGTKNVCELPPVKPDPKDPKPEEDPKNPQPEGPKDPKDPKPEGPKNPKDPQPEGPKNPKDPQPEGPKNPKDPQPEGPKNPKDPKPNEPGTPGETPNRPNEPGKPGEDPKTPEGPKENSKTEEKGEVSTPVDDEKLAKQENKSTNPKTGIGSVAPIVTSMGISIAGLLATKKKKKED